MDGANENTNLRMNVIYCQIHNAMEAGGGGRTFEGGTGVRADRHVACGESMRLGGFAIPRWFRCDCGFWKVSATTAKNVWVSPIVRDVHRRSEGWKMESMRERGATLLFR